jgi:hypothetical protein
MTEYILNLRLLHRKLLEVFSMAGHARIVAERLKSATPCRSPQSTHGIVHLVRTCALFPCTRHAHARTHNRTHNRPHNRTGKAAPSPSAHLIDFRASLLCHDRRCMSYPRALLRLDVESKFVNGVC